MRDYVEVIAADDARGRCAHVDLDACDLRRLDGEQRPCYAVGDGREARASDRLEHVVRLGKSVKPPALAGPVSDSCLAGTWQPRVE